MDRNRLEKYYMSRPSKFFSFKFSVSPVISIYAYDIFGTPCRLWDDDAIVLPRISRMLGNEQFPRHDGLSILNLVVKKYSLLVSSDTVEGKFKHIYHQQPNAEN